jgi:hypothetical protein
MKSCQCLQSPTVVRVAQSILLVATVAVTLGLILVDRCQPRKAPPAPGTERAAPIRLSHAMDTLV